mmetsp:Transcript_25730/g.81205  ORF Transcript_25730/g.81205 Transcript_25730/m.81205 type:complete len:270 (-) Transcript_25730:926-1735(-)
MAAVRSVHERCVAFAVRQRGVGLQRKEALDQALVPTMGCKEQCGVALAVLEVDVRPVLVGPLHEPDLDALLVLPLALGQKQQSSVAFLISHAQVTAILNGGLRSPDILLVDGTDEQGTILLRSLLLRQHVPELMCLFSFVLRDWLARHLLPPILERVVRLKGQHLDHVSSRSPKGVLLSGVCTGVEEDLRHVRTALLRGHHQRRLPDRVLCAEVRLCLDNHLQQLLGALRDTVVDRASPRLWVRVIRRLLVKFGKSLHDFTLLNGIAEL